MGRGLREVWFESQQDSEAVGGGEVAQGACKRGKRWGPQEQKHLKVTQGKRSPSGKGKERQGEWRECSGAGHLGRTVQCQMCSARCAQAPPGKGWEEPPGFWSRVGIAMLLTG